METELNKQALEAYYVAWKDVAHLDDKGKLLYALCAYLEALPKDDGWRPISTAPRDGMPILLCGGDDPVNKVLPVVVAKYVRCIGAEGFVYAHWDSSWRSSATRWMPLQQPPKEEK